MGDKNDDALHDLLSTHSTQNNIDADELEHFLSEPVIRERLNTTAMDAFSTSRARAHSSCSSATNSNCASYPRFCASAGTRPLRLRMRLRLRRRSRSC